MSYDSDLDSMRTFVRQVRERPTVQLKFDVEVMLSEHSESSRLELESLFEQGEYAERPVEIRVESDDEDSIWVATAYWTESGNMSIEDVQKMDVSGPVDVELPANHRITLPPSSLATIELADRGSFSVEPVDLSLGGVGLWIDRELSLAAGDELEVSLAILGEFLSAFPGTVAFVDDDDGETRLGVMFDDLTDTQTSQLRVAMKSLLAETSYG